MALILVTPANKDNSLSQPDISKGVSLRDTMNCTIIYYVSHKKRNRYLGLKCLYPVCNTFSHKFALYFSQSRRTHIMGDVLDLSTLDTDHCVCAFINVRLVY